MNCNLITFLLGSHFAACNSCGRHKVCYQKSWIFVAPSEKKIHSSVQPVSLGDDWRSADFHVGMSSALRVPTGIPVAGRATAMGKGAIEVAEGLRKKKTSWNDWQQNHHRYSVLKGRHGAALGDLWTNTLPTGNFWHIFKVFVCFRRCHMPCPMIGKNGPKSIALARHWRIRKWSTQRHTAFFGA